jgi:hypothetical protein
MQFETWSAPGRPFNVGPLFGRGPGVAKITKTAKRQPARAVARDQGDYGFWLDHAEIHESDFEWLADVQRLTLWNVAVPPGFLARLTKLWWLDIRGGSGADLEVARGAMGLRYLAVNQVRGMRDLSLAAALPALEYLDVYGLAQLTALPSFRSTSKLEHASLGQLRGLPSFARVLDAPNLRELQLSRKMNASHSDVERIRNHPALQRFSWFAEDVPVKVWGPVVEAIALPPVPVQFPADWFKAKGHSA